MYRLLDAIFSGLAIIVLFPLLLPLIVLLRLTGEGEVFYLQERIGLGGKRFKLFKFATMLKNSPNIGSKDITIENDPRVLPLGAFLRKSKINELPQLLNILIGDISVVGPRPMVPATYQQYSKEVLSELDLIRPGLTGIGSIVFRDEEKFLSGHDDPNEFYREIIIPYKSSLEIWYVQNRSLIIYFKVILATALAILFPSKDWQDFFFKGLPKPPEVLL